VLLEVSVGVGFSLTRSNSQKQLTAEASNNYDTPGYDVGGGLRTLFTTQKSTGGTRRNNVWGRLTKKFNGRWGAGAPTDYLTSSQQNLELRTVVGGSPAYKYVRSDRLNVSGTGATQRLRIAKCRSRDVKGF
jgi:hypothetical protein